MEYKSDIVLGESYFEPRTGIEGTAVALAFYEYACERTTLEVMVRGKLEEYTFDSPRLTRSSTKEPVSSERPGSPRFFPSRTGSA